MVAFGRATMPNRRTTRPALHGPASARGCWAFIWLKGVAAPKGLNPMAVDRVSLYAAAKAAPPITPLIEQPPRPLAGSGTWRQPRRRVVPIVGEGVQLERRNFKPACTLQLGRIAPAREARPRSGQYSTSGPNRMAGRI